MMLQGLTFTPYGPYDFMYGASVPVDKCLPSRDGGE